MKGWVGGLFYFYLPVRCPLDVDHLYFLVKVPYDCDKEIEEIIGQDDNIALV